MCIRDSADVAGIAAAGGDDDGIGRIAVEIGLEYGGVVELGEAGVDDLFRQRRASGGEGFGHGLRGLAVPAHAADHHLSLIHI